MQVELVHKAIIKEHDGVAWSVCWNGPNQLISVGQDQVVRFWKFIPFVSSVSQLAEMKAEMENFPISNSFSLQHSLVTGQKKTLRSVSVHSGSRMAIASFDGTVITFQKSKNFTLDIDDDNSMETKSKHIKEMENDAIMETTKKGNRRNLQNNFEWKAVMSLDGHENEVKSVDWHQLEGRWLATCGRDKTVWIWHRDPDSSHGDQEELECFAVLTDHTQDVKCVRWHPLEPLLLSSSYDDTIRVWELDYEMDEEWYCALCLAGHLGTVWEVEWEPLYKKNSLKAKEKICDNEEGFERKSVCIEREIENDDYQDENREFSLCGGNYFASVGDDGCIVIWERISSRPLRFEPIQRIWNAHGKTIYSINWINKKNKAIIATGSADRTIAIWIATYNEDANENSNDKNKRDDNDESRDSNNDNREKLGEFKLAYRIEQAHDAEINCVRWNKGISLENSDNILFLASCADDGSVCIWSFKL